MINDMLLPLDINKMSLPQKLKDFLVCRDFMTDQLNNLGHLHVDIIAEQKGGRITNQEKDILNISNRDCGLRRQVYLCIHQSPYIYGQVVIPRQTLENIELLQKIGHIPLGRQLKQLKAKRGGLHFFCVKYDNLLYQQALVKINQQPSQLILRYSVFVIDNHDSLLVYEVLLPDLYEKLVS